LCRVWRVGALRHEWENETAETFTLLENIGLFVFSSQLEETAMKRKGVNVKNN
jgi:hypothetical protein